MSSASANERFDWHESHAVVKATGGELPTVRSPRQRLDRDALLLRQGVAPGYVMLFAMTLGIYSIVPSIYLWREVSKPLSVILFVFFVLVGWVCGLKF